MGIERRRAVRWRGRAELPSVRLRGGHDAVALDVAAGGILIETRLRLRPGSSIELHVTAGDRISRLRGLIVRCSVSRLHAARVFYQGAIQFDEQVAWLTRDGRGYPVLTGEMTDQRLDGQRLPASSNR
jgi:hypothetical protein